MAHSPPSGPDIRETTHSCPACRDRPQAEGAVKLEIEYILKSKTGICTHCNVHERVTEETRSLRSKRERSEVGEIRDVQVLVTQFHPCEHTVQEALRKEDALEIQEGYESQYCFQTCKKNPNHEQFSPVTEFTLDKLPLELQDPQLYECIKGMISLTVKLELDLDKVDDDNKKVDDHNKKNDDHNNKVDDHNKKVDDYNKKLTKVGSGSLYIAESDYDFSRPCPCDECQSSVSKPARFYRFIRVTTALHVIDDEKQAKKTTVHIDYDDKGKSKVTYLRGHAIVRSDRDADRCILECVTHDKNFYRRVLKTRSRIRVLERKLKARYKQNCPNFALIISHPHGVEKRISFGKITEKYVNHEKDFGSDRQRTSFKHNVPTCQGSSGAVLWILGLERVGYMDHMITDHTHSAGQDGNINNSGEGLENDFPNIEGIVVHNHALKPLG